MSLEFLSLIGFIVVSSLGLYVLTRPKGGWRVPNEIPPPSKPPKYQPSACEFCHRRVVLRKDGEVHRRHRCGAGAA
jgi:hypothetical protein